MVHQLFPNNTKHKLKIFIVLILLNSKIFKKCIKIYLKQNSVIVISLLLLS